MTNTSRTKGHSWERTVARKLSDAGIRAERNLVEPQQGNAGDLVTDAPLSIQCKAGARPSVWRAIREAEEASKGNDYAVAVVKRTKAGTPREELAVMPLNDWLEIVGLLKGTGIW